MTSPEPGMGQTVDPTALERSQDAIDEGQEAAKKALPESDPTPDLDVPTLGDDEQDVTPRPN